MANSQYKQTIKSDLGRNLLKWFLIIGIIPLLIISILYYQISYFSLKDQIYDSLEQSTLKMSEIIKNDFSNILTDLSLEAQSERTTKILTNLNRLYKESGKNLENFVKSYKYLVYEEQYCNDLKILQKNKKFCDIFLIDIDGNNLFSVHKESDFGTNIFTGKYSNTLLANTCKKTINTGQPAYSDLEFYEPSNNQPMGFVTDAVLSMNGDIIGIIAFQVDISFMIESLQTEQISNINYDTYLIGEDLIMRSDSPIDNKNNTLIDTVSTKITRIWKSEIANKNETRIDKAKIYKGRNGYKVIGIHRNLDILGVKMAIISELRADEAFKQITLIKIYSIIELFIVLFVVCFIAITRSKKILIPIISISDWAKNIAQGNLTSQSPVSSFDEINTLSESFNKMVNILKNTAAQANLIANGDFSADIQLLSDDDKLGISLQQMTSRLRNISEITEHLANGNTSYLIEEKSTKDSLAISINKMTDSLKNYRKNKESQLWETTGLSEVNKIVLGETNIKTISNNICSYLAEYLNLPILTFYIMNDDKLSLTGSYALNKPKNRIEINEGIVGQVAREKKPISISNIPEDYIKINSSLGESSPKYLIANPLVYNDKLYGIIELGSFYELNETQLSFLNKLSGQLALAILSILNQNKVQELLEETQAQSEELQAQQEELRVSNEELLTQTESLKESQIKMEMQQEELRVSNEELEEKTEKIQKNSKDLVKQKIELANQNDKLHNASTMLKQKAKELEISSKYKSEFLANMSHELRTPLNSLLMLSKNLEKNKKKNLTEKQIKNIQIIYNSGIDLLKLINEILDLSKIESGKMNVNFENINILNFKSQMFDLFSHVAKEKDINFVVNIDTESPEIIKNDIQKLGQIIKNLLSNAFKFTEHGEIKFDIFIPNKDTDLSRSGLISEKSIAFSVIDNGIGIPEEKQLIIFEAFQQVDGSISRKFAGTGLGLSISTELAKLIGGEIQLKSIEGEGSNFTLYIPQNIEIEELIEKGKLPDRRKRDKTSKNITSLNDIPQTDDLVKNKESIIINDIHINDDRLDIDYDNESILLIEDNQDVAQVLYDICHEKKLKCLHAGSGEAGLSLIKSHKPQGIILDINLPGISGISVLDELKNNPDTNHIPVHIMSGHKNYSNLIKKGAISFLGKPIIPEELDKVINQIISTTKKANTILIIDNEKEACKEIKDIIKIKDVKIKFAHSYKDGENILENNKIDLIIFGFSLPDKYSLQMLQKLKKLNKNIPIIIYSNKKFNADENKQLIKYADTTILKTPANFNERLFDEVSLFLHTAMKNKAKISKNTLNNIYSDHKSIYGKTVLIVDDDMRNLYSIEEELRELNLNVVKATDGQMAIDILVKNNEIDIVLMDIMMPIMDGFEAMKQIRKTQQIADIPIVAVTAKAMKEDREECIRSGADDYLSKPIDIDKLIKLIKIWIR